MVTRRILQTRLFAAFTAVFAAGVAALAAHVAIDLAGDVLLAHDTYDGVTHQSRGEMLAGGCIVLVAGFLHCVWRALLDACSGRRAARLRFDDVFGRTPWRFVAAVVLLALPALMVMEFVDVAAAAGRSDDVADLLGGSAALGTSITALCALVCAAAVRRIARYLFASHAVLVAAIGRIIVLPAPRVVAVSGYAEPWRRRRARRHRSLLSRRSGKRGPPLFAS